MYGDPDEIRALARALRDRAEEIRGQADRLAARAEAVAWAGHAADTMRVRARAGAGGLRRTAALHDEAAQALERHARAAAGVLEEIDRVEHLITGALHRLGLHLETPVHGSVEWLHVHVPHWLRSAA
jgi:uncharacterized protein YukE